MSREKKYSRFCFVLDDEKQVRIVDFKKEKSGRAMAQVIREIGGMAYLGKYGLDPERIKGTIKIDIDDLIFEKHFSEDGIKVAAQ